MDAVGQELAQRAFALIHAVGHVAELVAQHLKVCDEVVCAVMIFLISPASAPWIVRLRAG